MSVPLRLHLLFLVTLINWIFSGSPPTPPHLSCSPKPIPAVSVSPLPPVNLITKEAERVLWALADASSSCERGAQTLGPP